MSNATSGSPSPTQQVSVTQTIKASPDHVWAMISDVTRMGEWSPETTSCTWTKGATGPAVGAAFTGNNKNGKKKWSTKCVVSQCEPGRRFAFEVSAAGLKISAWAYGIEPGNDADSCTVTETWSDRRGALVVALGKPLSGVAERHEHNRAGMAATLSKLAEFAELP